jgi:hypothetical protein
MSNRSGEIAVARTGSRLIGGVALIAIDLAETAA